jgi:hypothetical protein
MGRKKDTPTGLYSFAWGQTMILPPIWLDSIIMLKGKETEWLQKWYAMVRIIWNFGQNSSSHPYHCFLSGSKAFEQNFEFGWMRDIYLNAWRQFKFGPHWFYTTTTDIKRISKKKSWCKNKIFVKRKSKSYIGNYGHFPHMVDLGSVIRRNQTTYFGQCKLKY